MIDLAKKKKPSQKQSPYPTDLSSCFTSPLIQSILGTMIIMICTYALVALSQGLDNAFLKLMGQFLIYKIHYLFILSLLFNYNQYFKKHSNESYRFFSPLPDAFSAALMAWMISHLLNTINIYSKLQFLQLLSDILYENLIPIFFIILLLGYILVLTKEYRGNG